MSSNGKKFDFSRFQHLDTDAALETDGVDTPVADSGIVLKVARAGGRNYGFEKHREAVSERWRKVHGRGTIKGDDLRTLNRDVFVICIRGWNEDVVGVPYSPEAARELIDLEVVYDAVVERASSLDAYRKERLEEAKEAAGNA